MRRVAQRVATFMRALVSRMKQALAGSLSPAILTKRCLPALHGGHHAPRDE